MGISKTEAANYAKTGANAGLQVADDVNTIRQEGGRGVGKIAMREGINVARDAGRAAKIPFLG